MSEKRKLLPAEHEPAVRVGDIVRPTQSPGFNDVTYEVITVREAWTPYTENEKTFIATCRGYGGWSTALAENYNHRHLRVIGRIGQGITMDTPG